MGHLSRKAGTMNRLAIMLLVMSLLLFPFAFRASPAQAAPQQTLAAWHFANVDESAVKVTESGTARYKATSGLHAVNARLNAVATSGSYTYEKTEGSVRTSGWDGGSGSKYWVATVSTAGYNNIRLSSVQHSSGTGPRNFKVQASANGSVWTDVAGGSLVLTGDFNCSGSSCTLTDAALPATMSNQSQLYIRWVMDSNTSVGGSSVGSSGSSRIKDVVITGEAIGSQGTPEKVAEWVFSNTGSNGLFPATGGSYQAASTMRGIGNNASTYSYTSGENSIRSEGWDGGGNAKHWMISLSTKHYQHLTLSSQQTSSSSGPRDFKAQFSTDRLSWSDIPNGSLTLTNSSFNCSGNTCKLVDLPLPSQANDSDMLYIRWIMTSDTGVSGGEIAGASSSRIKDVVVKGVRNSGATITNPTVPVTETPSGGARDVALNAPVSIQFNKNISIVSGYSVSIKDQNNNSVSNVTAQVVNGKTLQINHADFALGRTYTVTLPRQMIKGSDNVVPGSAISWDFQSLAKTPSSFNMTFNGDTKTSIAFNWYTPTGVTGSIVQVVEASLAPGSTFPAHLAAVYSGSTETIQTRMTAADRSPNRTVSFASHKVIASGLTPGTTYKYRAGNGEADGWGPTGTFTTDTAAHQNFRFLYTTDTQGSSLSNFKLWQDTLSRSISHTGAPKFVVVTGDLVDDGDLEQQWQWFLGEPAQELANLPIVPVVGNHEVEDYPNNNFYYHFNLPRDVGTGALDGSVYAFEYGDVLFMTINTQYKGKVSPYQIDSQLQSQFDWLRSTAAKSDKKWKIVAMHKGTYSTGANTVSEFSRVQFYRQYMMPLFDEIGVDLVLQGHDHIYMRSKQMYNDAAVTNVAFDGQGNALNPKGTVYLMGNTAAAKFYEPDSRVNDYFSQINAQPNKKMFVDVSVTADVLTLTSYTAAKGETIAQYDKYSMKRTDTRPNKVQNAGVSIAGTQALLTWSAPSGGPEPARGYRIYEADNKLGTNWSLYVPSVAGQTSYSRTINNVSSSGSYTFVIKAVGVRNNSESTEVAAGSSTGGVTLPVISDSYVRGGTYSTINYSTETTMTVKSNDSNPSSVRQGYLKFNKSSVSGPITSAKIRLYAEGIHSDVTSAPMRAFGILNNSWSESGITFANQPTESGVSQGSATAYAAPGYIELDVTTFVNSQSGDTLSFRIVGLNHDAGAILATKEHATSSRRPVLLINGG